MSSKSGQHTFYIDAGLFAAVAATEPQPFAASVHETTRLAPIRAALGAQTPEEGLVAMMAAQELLAHLAQVRG